MRLQLILTLLPVFAAAQEDGGREVSASVHVYTDDDRVTVVTPSADAHAAVSAAVSADAHVLVDSITAASVDVTSQASPYGFHERRVEEGTILSVELHPQLALSSTLMHSSENDYWSWHAGVGVRLEAFQRNSIFDLRYTQAWDEVGRAGDPIFAKDRSGQHLQFAYHQVVDPSMLADLVVDLEHVGGYQANPYRFVPIYGAGGLRLYSLPERLPEDRHRIAGLLRLRKAVSSASFLHADYRFYADDWGVLGHTASALWLTRFGEARAGLQFRGSWQEAASFYRREYQDVDGAPAWRTRARELGGLWSVSAGVVGDVVLSRLRGAEPWRLNLSLGLARFSWADFALQDQRDAILSNVGVVAPF